MSISRDIAYHNQHITEKLEGSPELTGSEYKTYPDRKVGEWAICSVVDIYQWYNRQVLRVAAQHAPEVLEKFRDGVSLDSKDVRALVTGVSPVDVIIEKILFKDKNVRTHLHQVLQGWEEEEMSVLVEARNCFVHALGHDTEGRVAIALKQKKSPWRLPLNVENGRVVVTADTAGSAIQIGLAQISIMDQQFGNRYDLPRAELPKRTITFRYRSC